MGLLGDRRPGRAGMAELVKTTRNAHRMTQRQVAEESAVSLSMLKKIEGGQRTPGAETIGRLAYVFGTEFVLRALALLTKEE